MSQKKKTYNTIIILIKLLVIIGIGVFIFLKLQKQHNINEAFIIAMERAVRGYWYLLIVVLVLMPVNWLLEAKKWEMLSNPVKKITIFEALKGVLAGLSVSFITPHGIGDYFARILLIKDVQRGKLVGGILVGRLFQLFATLAFGGVGIFYLFGTQIYLAYVLLLSCMIISFVLLVSFSFKFQNKWIKKLAYYVDIIKAYSFYQLLYVLFLAMLRYVVFSIQFVLVLSMFTELKWILKAAGTTWILLAKSIIPTFNFLSDLGVREFSAIYFFEQFNVPLVPVLSASLLVWIINILVPTIAGAPLVWKLKIKV